MTENRTLRILQAVAEQPGFANEINERARVEVRTLYALLSRLVGKGLLRFEMRTVGARRRRWYDLTDTGRALIRPLTLADGELRQLAPDTLQVLFAALLVLVEDNHCALDNLNPEQWQVAEALYGRVRDEADRRHPRQP
jgi:DNA-binding MarR family transcriptional regulator